MAIPVKVKLVNREIEPGWDVVENDVPLGKIYTVDMDSVRKAWIFDMKSGQKKLLEVVWVISPEPAGWLPYSIFIPIQQ